MLESDVPKDVSLHIQNAVSFVAVMHKSKHAYLCK